jgi:hypothetical protein
MAIKLCFVDPSFYPSMHLIGWWQGKEIFNVNYEGPKHDIQPNVNRLYVQSTSTYLLSIIWDLMNNLKSKYFEQVPISNILFVKIQ